MSPSLPRPGALLGACAGFALLGACAALGAPAFAPLPFAALALGAAAGAIALSTPTLLVAGEYLGHPAPPAALAAAPLDAFVRVGRVALWLGPVLLFFVTAGNAAVAYQVAGVGLAIVGLAVGARGIAASARGLVADGAPAPHPRVVPLAVGWVVLTGALALHLSHRLLLAALS